MLALRCYSPCIRGLESLKISTRPSSVVVCASRGPRPRHAPAWNTKKRFGTISKSAKLLECIKGLSSVKEEVYGALDSFVAWELEFPLITVKKAIKILEVQREWKRLIQVTKWMLSKGQGRTMGTYSILLNALIKDGRLEEAEELWNKLLAENLDRGLPRFFFNQMIAVYYHREMYDKMFELFADMEELDIRPNVSIVTMTGEALQKLGMLDRYAKLNRKYPPPRWIYKYIRGKRVKVRMYCRTRRSRPGPGIERLDDFEVSSEDRDGFEPEGVDQVLDSNGLLEDADVVISRRNDTQG